MLSRHRDPLHQVCGWFGWTNEGGGVLRTEDGPLSLLLDGWSAVLAVAERAWVMWMWGQESRVRRDADYADRRGTREPWAQAHIEWNNQPRMVEGGDE